MVKSSSEMVLAMLVGAKFAPKNAHFAYGLNSYLVNSYIEHCQFCANFAYRCENEGEKHILSAYILTLKLIFPVAHILLI